MRRNFSIRLRVVSNYLLITESRPSEGLVSVCADNSELRFCVLVDCSNISGRSFIIISSFTGGLLFLHSSVLSGSLARGSRKSDELLTGLADHERGRVDKLFADSDVALSDKNSGVMDGETNVSLHHEGLETTFHELGDGKSQDVIELALRFVEETDADHTADEGIT